MAEWTNVLAAGVRAATLTDEAHSSKFCLWDDDFPFQDDRVGCTLAPLTMDVLQTGSVTVMILPDVADLGGTSFTLRLVQR